MNPQLIELMHVLSATKTQVFKRVRFYAALPYAFAALKVSVTMCVLGAIVGEWIGANSGIGLPDPAEHVCVRYAEAVRHDHRCLDDGDHRICDRDLA